MSEEKIEKEDEFDELEKVKRKFYVLDKVFIKLEFQDRIKDYVKAQGNRFTESKFVNMCIEKFFDKEEAKNGGISPVASKKIGANYDMLREIVRREIIISNLFTKIAQISEQDRDEIINRGNTIADEFLAKIIEENKIEY